MEERPNWTELEKILGHLENEPGYEMNLEQLKRFHYLYERASADLGKLVTFASEPDTRRFLEALIARAYGEIHETREKPHRLRPLHWFAHTFPQTFRRHVRAFWLSLLITGVGCAFGGMIIAFDPESKSVIMPFSHLGGNPADRVAREEKAVNDKLADHKASFSTTLMTHNTQVSIFTMALGATWGVGTTIMLFYNGVILGAVCVDYILAGQTRFLVGWLLPHGSFEIPAILIAGQAGLLLGRAFIGTGNRISLKSRLREISSDLVTLIGGVGVMLIWAGFVEAFFSQYHEPVLPYSVKIGFGLLELALLILFLAKSGRTKRTESK
ncbi:MAG: stage II sporulation protein M [Verrucomicrobiota bacterium]